MENLSAKVYECTLAVEAHMIVDLLARAGISARIDGEFLSGAGGDLPLGSTIKVRVDPARAAEAREVIDEWEKLQPPPESAPPRPRSSWSSPLWFAVGAICGFGAAFAMMRADGPGCEAGARNARSVFESMDLSPGESAPQTARRQWFPL